MVTYLFLTMPSFYLSMSTGRQVLTWVDAFMRTCKSPDKIIGCKVLASHPNGVVILGKTLCYVNWSYYRHILDSTRCFPYFRPMCVTVPLLKLNVEFPKKWRVDFFLYSHSRHFVVRLFQLAVWNTARVICPDISKLMPIKTRKLANINKFMRQKKLWRSCPQIIYFFHSSKTYSQATPSLWIIWWQSRCCKEKA